MKKILLALTALLAVAHLMAQSVDTDDINSRNSWLKIGASAGVPVGDMKDASKFALGLDLRGQFMTTPHFGLGVATGYTNYFVDGEGKDLGAIPLGLMLRAYPKSSGIFIGSDIGYSFLVNSGDDENDGGLYVQPQIGYHNYNWNIYGFYNHIFYKENFNVPMVGVTVSRNIRFN